MTIEYRVKRVERFVVTRHEQDEKATTGSTRQIGGEHDNFEVAYEVGYALARQEAETLGLMPGDMGVIYPSRSLEDARSAEYAPSAPVMSQGHAATEGA